LARPGAYFFFFAAFFLGALQQGTVVTSFANHLPVEDFSFPQKSSLVLRETGRA
jgi:hypothetical protein